MLRGRPGARLLFVLPESFQSGHESGFSRGLGELASPHHRVLSGRSIEDDTRHSSRTSRARVLPADRW